MTLGPVATGGGKQPTFHTARAQRTVRPFCRVQATVMPAGNHERDMGGTVRGHSAVCAMAIPFTAWKHMHFTVE